MKNSPWTQCLGHSADAPRRVTISYEKWDYLPNLTSLKGIVKPGFGMWTKRDYVEWML